MNILIPLFFATFTAALAGVPSVGPNYVRPQVSAPGSFRDTTWKTAAPADQFPRGEWWKLFADPVLDDLEQRALTANQDLHAAAARVEQARATAGEARSAYWPSLAVAPSASRERSSATTDNPLPNQLTTTYRAPLQASWELDLFGRIRRQNESARATAASSEANFESVKLALTADVASTYFSARAFEQETAILRDTLALRRRALDLVNARRKGGSVADLDVARAETEVASAEADLAAVANARAVQQNALAVLVGEIASDFTLAAASAPTAIPAIPVGVPAELLERRPDIAAAERALAAANARIGVAKAAFFPAISLTGGAGFASGEVDRLFQVDSRIWAIGPSLYLPIFQGGRNRANLSRSRAAFEETLAAYRERVLVAFREVQDALTATQLLAQQSAAQDRAIAHARRAAALAQTRYDAGFVSFLEVIDAQRTALATERASAQLGAQRLNNSVALVKALGGGWHLASAY